MALRDYVAKIFRRDGQPKAFDAGKHGRRLRAIPASAWAINTQIRTYGKTIVSRSRYLAANNAYASAAKEAYVSALVGSGIKPSSLAIDKDLRDAIHTAFRDWTDEADADGQTDFYGLQAIIAAEMFEAGECFVRLRSRYHPDDGLTVPLQLQVMPSEMLPFDKNEVLPGGRRIECGIEFDAIGRRIAYHFYRQHPGEDVTSWNIARGEFIRVPANQILHLFKPIRAGQLRGIPHTLSGLVTLALLDLYDDAELERKRTAALFAGFITRKSKDEDDHPLGNPSAGTSAGTGGNQFGLEPGALIDLELDEDIKFSDPADVGGSYEAFQYRNLLRAACGFGVPYAAMTGDLRQTSYGSIRAGLVEFRRRIEASQHQVMVYQLCRPVWRRWMTDAVLAGVIKGLDIAEFSGNVLELLRCKWIPPKWEWVDPAKDRQAEQLAVNAGFKARSDVIEAEGYDPEETDRRIKADQDRADELGLRIGGNGSLQLQPPQQSDPDSDDEESTETVEESTA